MSVCAVSSWLSSMIAILPEDSGSLSASRPITTTWSPISSIERTQVEDDGPALGLDELGLVVQQAHELALRPGRRLHPQRLHARSLERRLRRPVGARARETGENRRQSLLCRRQALRDRGLDVDVREQPVDGCRGDLGADLVVFDHLPRDRLEPVFVEDRVLDVEREHPDEREQDRHDGERARTDPAQSGRSSRIRVVRHVGHHDEHRL